MREDWIECKVSDVAEKVVVGFVGSSKPYYVDNGIPFLTGKNVRSWGLDLDYFDSVSRDFHEKNKKSQLRKNDVVVVRIGHSGTAAVVTDVLEEANCGGLIIVKQPKAVIPKYMALYFNSPSMKQWSVNESMGVTRMTLNTTKVSNAIINVPCYSEQRAIVTKIEELFSELDKGEEDLKKAQEQLKIYRQAVLKKAFEGELTKEWREQQTDLPTADELLEQIKEERQRNYDGQLEKWKKAVKVWEDNQKEGKKPSKPKANSSLPVLTKKEKSALPALSSSWSWIKLDQIGELFCGQSPSVSDVNTEGKGMLYVTGPEQWNGREIEEIKWTEFPKRIVPDGCIFITVKGAGVGKLFPGVHCAIGRDVYAFKPDTKINFNYVYYALKHSIDIVVMKALGDIPGLSKNHILDHYLGFCSQEEQYQIVKEIESRLSVCDSIEAGIRESLDKSKALRQSILKKAFEGTLLSEEEIAACKAASDYEPASVLLERIKAEKKKK